MFSGVSNGAIGDQLADFEVHMARPYPQDWHKAHAAEHGATVAQFPSLPAASERVEGSSVPAIVLEDDGTERKLESIIRHRRARQEHFPDGLFADPAWDILLNLALAQHQQRRVCVSSLCIGAQVPTTTALRWIKHMTETGWLVRKDDPLDARRKFVELSGKSWAKMTAFLEQVGNEVST